MLFSVGRKPLDGSCAGSIAALEAHRGESPSCALCALYYNPSKGPRDGSCVYSPEEKRCLETYLARDKNYNLDYCGEFLNYC